MTTRIFVATPMMREMDGKARLYGRALSSIFNLRYSGQLDHYFANGDDDYSDGNTTVTRKYAEARDMFLAGDWTHFVAAEYDMVIPPDGLERLLALDTDIAYSLYVFRHGLREGRYLWSAATTLEERRIETLSKDTATARAAWGSVIETKGVGLGFTVIKRHVIASLTFRNWKGVSCDWALAVDAQARGYKQLCDTSVSCGHTTIVPNPQILWADPLQPEMARIEYL